MFVWRLFLTSHHQSVSSQSNIQQVWEMAALNNSRQQSEVCTVTLQPYWRTAPGTVRDPLQFLPTSHHINLTVLCPAPFLAICAGCDSILSTLQCPPSCSPPPFPCWRPQSGQSISAPALLPSVLPPPMTHHLSSFDCWFFLELLSNIYIKISYVWPLMWRWVGEKS